MHSDLYILTLLQIPKIGRRTVRSLLDVFSEPIKDLSDLKNQVNIAKQTGIRRLVIPTDDQLQTAFNTACTILDDAGQHRVEVIGFSNPMFPPRLRQIPDPPVIIYVKGSMDCLLAPSLIAVVGTRSPSPYGEKCAKRFGFRLAEKGIGVVSGLAIGCDTAAHTGCLAANGQTIAVLAHGLDTVSPARNRDLASQIQDANGSLVSEYPIGTPARRNSFVDRDRLQIGLSDGLLVVETGVKGGTMHTVKYCGEQEKPLACLDHPLDYQPHQKSAGNQMLIKDGKAFPLSVAGDLLTFIDQLKNRENN